ncbi:MULTISPECIES: hypothetical protein [Streptomycetaceae]|uniref:Putative lipoprotein n=1 Tax=Streptantibioticus cattleyicolor (strain ATCC 35852 / DSM 46488 / JCM 4925 / NBRC 14057 / NRRL 8057) TaxID=1003195 RepID=F8K062_STREN|nr:MULTISPECIES: hypothetical protein [Streptomycetaceae]AEW94846.1 putative lipoprotein [Streptantibioticus cattleyicolor NRRL 8057 = DSM 46488]MYS59465.1 hypothetical protein [Streptomyces sp. SID5468]CCB75200.1 putative lipoprotein [Streptantibioticus cattleyicolor NRRL 8057 = DSM 46488]
MSRSLRRGALAAVLALSVVPFAAACGAGDDSQTLQVQPNVVSTSVGDIQIQNANIITEPNGKGPATVTARVFNNSASPQQLTSISVDGVSTPVKLTGPDGKTGPLTVPANGAITLGGAGNPSAVLSDSAGLSQGDFHKTTFSLSSTGQVSLSPLVVPATHYFQTYGASVEATPAPGGSASAPAGKPSGSPSGKPGTPAGHGEHGHVQPSSSAKETVKP